MAIHYPDILDEVTEPRTFSYGDREVMLYALGVGMGADPLDPRELDFVYERRLKVMPSAVTVLEGRVEPRLLPMPAGRAASTLDYTRFVHGEQWIELHRPLPGEGTFTTQTRVTAAFDKGADKGAVVYYETTWTDDADRKVATLTRSIFARGDGGFGGPASGGLEPHAPPQRPADISVDLVTRPDQAAIYRLSGDRNPLHIDPERAVNVGFPRPILHGLCTYGLTCRAVLQAITDYDPEPILRHQARFSAPVYPGDTVTVDLWKDGNEISFEARVKDRNVVVIRNGKTTLRA